MTATPDNMPIGAWIDLLSGKYYGMMFLGLANAAYTAKGKRDVKDISNDVRIAVSRPAFIPKLPKPGQAGIDPKSVDHLDGVWQVDWGPAISPELSNLVYIASFRAPPGPNQRVDQGEPYLFVVAIRGTDTSTGLDGVIDQVAQDLDAFTTHSWSEYLTSGVEICIDKKLDIKKCFGPPPGIDGPRGPDPKGCVASGSIMAFTKLASATEAVPALDDSDGATVAVALQALLNAYPGTPVVVTGHSLGGCQTQTMTSFLQWQFPNDTIICHPFAPSTAGDVDFASDVSFKRGCFWWNKKDLVPCAYEPAREDGWTPNLDVTWAETNLWHSYTWPAGSIWPPQGTSGSTDYSYKSCPALPEDFFIHDIVKKHGSCIADESFARPVPPDDDNPSGPGGSPTGKLTDCPLDGEIPTPQFMRDNLDLADPTKPLSMLLWQHFPPWYRLLMWDNYKSEVVYFDYKSFIPG